MASSMPDFLEEVKLTADNTEEDLSCSIEVGTAQKASSDDLPSTSNFQSDEHFSTCNGGQEVSALVKHVKDIIINTGESISEEWQTLSPELSPLETVKVEVEDLRSQDSDENVHSELAIVGRYNDNGNQLEATNVQSDLSHLTVEDTGAFKKDDDKETLANENGADASQANECSIKEAVFNEDPKACGPDIVAANHSDHDGTRSIGVWKHVISKSSAGKTSKVVRTEVDAQSTSSHCAGSRITRTPYRKNSPLNWFPRKKTESYLERKIRMLQETEGMKTSLDETLVGSNIRLSRVEREKRAVKAAAKQAMETRKAALVEASWCRILEAARIPCSLAVLELEKAEKKATEALATAVALGVIMKNHPGSSKHSCEPDTSSNEEGSNHIVTASFETAFEVDKEVAAAVKVAFRRLAHFPGSTLKDILDADPLKCRSQNQDATDVQSENDTQSPGGLDRTACSTETCSEAEIQPDSELDREEDGADSAKLNAQTIKVPLHNKVSKKLPSPQELSEDLVKLMLERLKFLTSEELASLEQIVATRGLGALLKEQNVEQEFNVKSNGGGLADVLVKHVSRLEAEKAAASKSTVLSRAQKKKNPYEDVPDLGSVLVKHVSKLEKEVEEAKKSIKAEEHKCTGGLEQKVESLDQVLIKRLSRLEREKLAAAESAKALQARKISSSVKSCAADHNRLGLGDILKKHPSNVKAKKDEKGSISGEENKDLNSTSEISLGVKQADLDTTKCEIASDDIVETAANNCEENTLQSGFFSLDKHSSKFEENKAQGYRNKRESMEQIEGLDKVLIKRMSRLQKEKLKLAAGVAANACDACSGSALNNSSLQDCNGRDLDHLTTTISHKNSNNIVGNDNEVEITNVVENSTVVQSGTNGIDSVYSSVGDVEKMDRSNLSSMVVPDLGSMLTKRVSKLEEEIQPAKGTSTTVQRPRERQLPQEESLENVLVRRLSKLERDKLAASAKEAPQSRSNFSMTSSDASAASLHNQTGADYIKGKDICNENGDEMIGTSTRVDAEIPVSNEGTSESSCTLIDREKKTNDSSLHSVSNGSTIEISEADPFQNVVKKMSRLEIEKKQAAALAAAGIDPWQRQKNTRAEELQSSWGGLGLGDSLKRHVSRLEEEQAAWRRAEEEQRKRPPHR